MADEARRKTDKTLAEMEKHLSGIYSRAEKELGKTWNDYMEQAAKKVKPFEEALEAAKKSGDADKIAQAEKLLEQKKKQATILDSHYKAMAKQISEELSHVNETAAAYINDKLPDIYTLNYNSTANGINGSIDGYSFELVDRNTVKNLATKDETLLPYKYIDGKKDVRWNTQMVNSEVMQGILQGESMQKIAKRLDNVVGMKAKGSAIRNARTTVTSAENKGRMDMLHDAQDKGIISHKIWLSSNQPQKTRDAHMPGDFEKLEVNIDDPFVNSIGKIMYPGDPEADPANVYNCRCTLIYKIVGFKKITKG